MGAAHVFEAVNDRYLTDDRTHAGIGRRKHEGVPARIGDAPDANAVRVHRLVSLEERDRVLVVADLRPRIEMLTVVAIADAKVAIIEDQCVQAGRSERRCIGRHHDLAHVTPAARQNDRRPRPGSIRLIQPRPTRDALRPEFDVQTFNHARCSPTCLSSDLDARCREGRLHSKEFAIRRTKL